MGVGCLNGRTGIDGLWGRGGWDEGWVCGQMAGCVEWMDGDWGMDNGWVRGREWMGVWMDGWMEGWREG